MSGWLMWALSFGSCSSGPVSSPADVAEIGADEPDPRLHPSPRAARQGHEGLIW